MAGCGDKLQHGKYAFGVICILITAFIWTFGTVLKQIIFQEMKFDHPIILAYICNMCYAVQLPVFALGRLLGTISPIPVGRFPCTKSSLNQEVSNSGSLAEAVILGLSIAPIWFMSHWTYSVGVDQTSVTNSTVISTTSVVWTLLAAVFFLGEKFTLWKVVGVVACMCGNVAVLFGSDTGGKSDKIMGDVFCLVSAMIYASYTTILKKFTNDDTSVLLLFGFLGLGIVVIGTPIVFALRREVLLNMDAKMVWLLIFNGLIDNVLSQFAWAKAVQWTSSTVATVGLSLTIPMGIVSDLIRQKPISPWSYVAAVLVAFGFFAVSLDAKQDTTSTSEEAPLAA